MNDQDREVEVDERKDGLWVTVKDVSPVAFLWRGTIKALQAMLDRNAYKRTKKQGGSNIGGDYTK